VKLPPVINRKLIMLLINVNSLIKKSSGLAFFLLFPAFYFFHYLLAVDALNLKIGFWGQVSAGFFLICCSVFLPKILEICSSDKLISFGFAFFIIYCCFSIIGHSLISTNEYTDQANVESGAMLISWVALFGVGVLSNFNDTHMKKILFFSYLVMFIIAAIYTDRDYFVLEFTNLPGEQNIASYQGFARSAAITIFAIACQIHRKQNRVIFFLTSLPLLFLLGARSEFYGFVFSFFFLEFFRSIRRPSNLVLFFIFPVIIALATLFFIDNLPSSRQLSALDLDSDSSWSARTEMANFAWQQILESPIIGVYGGHYMFNGEAGAYAHNILSAWVSFGLLGFLLVSFISLTSMITCTRAVLRKSPSNTWILAFYVNAFSTLLLLVAKPIFWPIPALAWGLIVSARWHDNHPPLKIGNLH